MSTVLTNQPLDARSARTITCKEHFEPHLDLTPYSDSEFEFEEEDESEFEPEYSSRENSLDRYMH